MVSEARGQQKSGRKQSRSSNPPQPPTTPHHLRLPRGLCYTSRLIPTRLRTRGRGAFAAPGPSEPQAGPTLVRARSRSPSRFPPATLCMTTGTNPSCRWRVGRKRPCWDAPSRQAKHKHTQERSVTAQGPERLGHGAGAGRATLIAVSHIQNYSYLDSLFVFGFHIGFT